MTKKGVGGIIQKLSQVSDGKHLENYIVQTTNKPVNSRFGRIERDNNAS